MLAATAVASPPLALMPLTTSSQAGSLRLDTTTLAPCAAICSQIERPMPRLPPVTTATLPLRSNIIGSSPRFSFGQERNELNMPRPQELVDGFQFLQPVPAVLQGSDVARKTAGIARGVDHARHLRTRKLCRLGESAGPRRLEQDRIEGVEFLGRQWIAKEIAPLRAHTIAAELARRRINSRTADLVAFV